MLEIDRSTRDWSVCPLEMSRELRQGPWDGGKMESAKSPDQDT